MKKILLLGGTGALGVYLTEELLKMDYAVDVVSKDEKFSIVKNLRYIQHEVKDAEFLTEFVKNEYDAIVDFMWYITMDEFRTFYPILINNTSHYVYLSSYRVYGNSNTAITEESKRIIDCDLPDTFVKEREYAIYKAEGENELRASGKSNWTILRPTITFSKRRFQIVTFEAQHFLHRVANGKPIPLPSGALEVQSTLSWAGDFGKMVARLLFNDKAYGQAFTVGTAEHHSWKEMAEIYNRIIGLKYIPVGTEEFIELIGGTVAHRQQLLYDRYFNRAIDNTKILTATGFKQSDLMSTEKGLRMELAQLDLRDIPFNPDWDKKVDNLLKL